MAKSALSLFAIIENESNLMYDSTADGNKTIPPLGGWAITCYDDIGELPGGGNDFHKTPGDP